VTYNYLTVLGDDIKVIKGRSYYLTQF